MRAVAGRGTAGGGVDADVDDLLLIGRDRSGEAVGELVEHAGQVYVHVVAPEPHLDLPDVRGAVVDVGVVIVEREDDLGDGRGG